MKKTLFAILMMLLVTNVNASSIESEIYEKGQYTNTNNVTIDLDNYNKIKSLMSESEIENIDARFYEAIKVSNDIKNIESAIIESTYLTVGNDEFLVNENILTQDEYNTRVKSRTSENDVYKIEYKQIHLMASEENNEKMSFYIQNVWQKTPKIKSFDVIALRWSGTVTPDKNSANGIQDYKSTLQQVNPPTITYANTSGNMKYFSNGVGLSQNLVDDASYYVNVLSINATCSGIVNLYGTYQHAQSDLSLTQSQNYTISSSGLGKVLYYSDTSIRNTYDNTAGLLVSFSC